MKQFFVHDTVLSTAILQNIQNYFAHNVRWQFGWPQGVSDPFSHWNIDFLGATLISQSNIENELFAKTDLAPIADAWRALKAGPMRGHYLLRCYANAHTYGVEGHPHTDTVDATQVENYTAVIYLNPVWKKEWAGELVMFNPAGDTLCGILPKAGRAALIPGDVVHAARGVSRQCPAVRVCIAFKSRLPTALELAQDIEIGRQNATPLSDVTNLYIDPLTQRVVYASAVDTQPTRSFVYEGNKLEIEKIFTPVTLAHVVYPRALPAGMYAQNSWGFKLKGDQLVSAV